VDGQDHGSFAHIGVFDRAAGRRDDAAAAAYPVAGASDVMLIFGGYPGGSDRERTEQPDGQSTDLCRFHVEV